jgi:hypothetical protein
MNGAHICMSGVLDCSGVAPCEACTSTIISYVLVPSMKAAGIDQRNDPRVASFLRTYAESRQRLIAILIEQAQRMAPPPPMVPPPIVPPMADVPLTAAELESMAAPVAVPTVPPPPMAGGPELVPEEVYVPPAAPAGLMTDEEFKAKFPTVPPEEVIGGYVPPPPPPVEEPSLLKLASQAITPQLPAEQPASDTREVGSAPTEPAPLPAPLPKAPTDDVSAVPVSTDLTAEMTKQESAQAETKAEASTHG